MSQAFERVFIIFFENENAYMVLQNPYFYKLATQGVMLTGYHGVTHPSQPNYIATIGGNFFNTSDQPIYPLLPDKSVVDLLEGKNVTWGAYIQDLPVKPLVDSSLYASRHNPFVMFQRNHTSERLAKIVDASLFNPDSIPQFCWYGPNIQNCGHTVPGSPHKGGSPVNINFAANWLEGFLDPLLQNQSFMNGTLVVLTFDEDWPQVNNGEPEQGCPVYTVLLGSMVKPGTIQPAPYTHYNLLATIEKNFGLGTLGQNDLGAATFDFLWS